MHILLQQIHKLKMDTDFASFLVIYLGLVFLNLEIFPLGVIKEKLVLQRGQVFISASVPLSNKHIFPEMSVLQFEKHGKKFTFHTMGSKAIHHSTHSSKSFFSITLLVNFYPCQIFDKYSCYIYPIVSFPQIFAHLHYLEPKTQ